MAEQNTFTGVNLVFRNGTIHAVLAEIIKFRKQLTVRSEFNQQSGWDNALNNYLVKGLEQINDSLENIVYNPSNKSLEELEAETADTSGSLMQDYADGKYSIHSDNVVMDVPQERPVLWTLDGSDPDIPQPTEDKYKNDFGRLFIKGLDELFVSLTRLDSRHQGRGVTKDESLRLRSKLNELITITQRKGGEANRFDIPEGTLPSEEPSTFNAQK